MKVEIHDLALFVKKERILVIGDVHIGYEEALNKEGVMVPRFQLEEALKRVKRLLVELKPDLVVICGDLKHEFGIISKQEWKDTLRFLEAILEHCKVVLVRGNHDTQVGIIARKRDVKVVDEFIVGDILMIHGDKEPTVLDGIKTIVIGHEHPAVSFKDLPGEKFKCFLVGDYKGRELIVLPSFHFMTAGTDVTKEKLLSPLLGDISEFECYIVEDKPRFFGKLKNIT